MLTIGLEADYISSLAANERGSGTVGYSAAYAPSKAALDRFAWALAADDEDIAWHGLVD